jgi:predicted nucleotidyltransferase
MQNNISLMRILGDFKAELKNLYGNKLKDIILYGSYARGEENEDSDIDLAIILKGNIKSFEEIDRMTEIACNIDLKYNVLLSIHPVSEDDYNSRMTPLLINIREEGVRV